MKKIRLTSGMRFVTDDEAEKRFMDDLGSNLGEIIAGLPVFSMLDKEQLKEILSLANLQKYAQGEYLIRENQAPERLYFLISGQVQVSKNNVKLGDMRRTGDIFGEMSFIDAHARSASIMAKKETLCLEVDMRGIDLSDIKQNSSFLAVAYRVFAEILAHRLRKMNEELIYLRGELTKSRAETKRV